MATNNYMPMGRNPRSGGAGQAASYKKGGMIKTKKYQGSGSNTVDPTKAINTFKKNTSMKKGGTTKVAGVMKSGGAAKKLNKAAMGGTSKKFLKTYQTGDPIKLKNSPLSGYYFEKASKGNLNEREKEAISYSNNMGKETSNAQYMANTSRSAANRIETKNALKKSNPESLSKYGYQTTNKGNVVDEQYKETTESDAKKLRQMATNRPIGDSQRHQSEQSLRGRKLAEGIQTPSMEKAKKPIIAAPKIDVAGARAKVKADAKREFYNNSKGEKVYVKKKGGPITALDQVQRMHSKNKK